MQWLELSPAEIAFLTPQAGPSDSLPTRLTRKLAATLTARLRLPVRAQTTVAADAAPADALATPIWHPDAALATLWLTRRLGGQRVMGATPFVPPTLIRTLDAALAESWLDAARTALPPALAWRLTTDSTQATLSVRLPHSTTDMTRWAREVIRYG